MMSTIGSMTTKSSAKPLTKTKEEKRTPVTRRREWLKLSMIVSNKCKYNLR
ncbi:hypothetical protein HanIR_Chr06g0269971 [Helianthus annuus]|nr:hypothetical protein HanIR_Chr06g0269971 [Helianthus annuus]